MSSARVAVRFRVSGRVQGVGRRAARTRSGRLGIAAAFYGDARHPAVGLGHPHFVGPSLERLDGKGCALDHVGVGVYYQCHVQADARTVSVSRPERSTRPGLSPVSSPAHTASVPPTIRDTPFNHFFDIELGSSGELWVASMPSDKEGRPEGMYRFDGEGWDVHGRSQGLPSNFAVAVARDLEERIWVGTWEKGIGVLGHDGVWRRLDQNNSVLRGITQPSNPGFVVISDIQRDAAGLMWIANIQAGLAVMDTYPPRRSHLYGLADLGMPPGTDLSKLAIGPDGLKWVATSKEGFALFDDGGTPFEPGDDAAVVVSTSREPRLSSNNVTAVAVAPSGVLWVGTDNGLHRLRVDYDRSRQVLSFPTWREYRLEHGLNSTFITAVAFDDQGNVWVGSRAGLTQLRTTGRLMTTFTTENSGLINDRVESLSYDVSTGTLWIGTFGGLGRLQVGLGLDAVDETAGVTAYPNPFVMGGRENGQVETGLRIVGLPLDSTVHLFSLEGRLIRILEAEPGATGIVGELYHDPNDGT